jgi:hypothetical protein
LNRTDPKSLYLAARWRGAVADILRRTPTEESARLADAEADRAMAWLRKAFAAGYSDIPHLLADADLAALRGRDDYADLLWDIADMPAPPMKP